MDPVVETGGIGVQVDGDHERDERRQHHGGDETRHRSDRVEGTAQDRLDLIDVDGETATTSRAAGSHQPILDGLGELAHVDSESEDLVVTERLDEPLRKAPGRLVDVAQVEPGDRLADTDGEDADDQDQEDEDDHVAGEQREPPGPPEASVQEPDHRGHEERRDRGDREGREHRSRDPQDDPGEDDHADRDGGFRLRAPRRRRRFGLLYRFPVRRVLDTWARRPILGRGRFLIHRSSEVSSCARVATGRFPAEDRRMRFSVRYR